MKRHLKFPYFSSVLTHSRRWKYEQDNICYWGETFTVR